MESKLQNVQSAARGFKQRPIIPIGGAYTKIMTQFWLLYTLILIFEMSDRDSSMSMNSLMEAIYGDHHTEYVS